MNRNKTDPLPGGVKIRSTCNSCQKAKIRCSHEKPSCRRCQKHKMRCVYSISRRLGRPAKKRDDMQDNSKDREVSEHPRGEIIRRDRSPRKRTAKPDLGQTSGHDIKHSQEHDEGILEEVAFNDSIVNDMSTEDTRLPAPPFLDADKLSLYEGSDTIDLSDNWLQEFISGQPADLAQDCDFLDALGLNSADGALMAVPPGTRGLTCSTNAIDVASSELQDQMPPTAYYLPASGFSAYSEPANGSAQVKAEIALPYPGPLKREWLAWPQTVPFLTEHDAARFPAMDEHLNPLITTKGKCHPPEYGPSSEGPTLSTATAARQYQCQCHDHLARDLMLLTISASRVGPSVTIDSILKCQQILQQLTDTILECPICCKTRVNLLMIVVVSIDSLITALETITSVEGGVWDGLFVEYHDSRLQAYGQGILKGTANHRYKNVNFYFKAQVEECPLLVGGFPIPTEEKFAFVKQVLHARLCALSSTIGRIRSCTEEILAGPSLWGRLSMMKETNQRVQTVMTKMKTQARS